MHFFNLNSSVERLESKRSDEAATELIIRSAQGNLRLCRNLCYASLIEACRETKKNSLH